MCGLGWTKNSLAHEGDTRGVHLIIPMLKNRRFDVVGECEVLQGDARF